MRNCIIKGHDCSTLLESINAYIAKADDNLSEELANAGYVDAKDSVNNASGLEDDLSNIYRYSPWLGCSHSANTKMDTGQSDWFCSVRFVLFLMMIQPKMKSGRCSVTFIWSMCLGVLIHIFANPLEIWL